MQKPFLSVPQVAGGVCALLSVAALLHWFAGIDVSAGYLPGLTQVGIVNPMLFLALSFSFFHAQAVQPGERSGNLAVRALGLLAIGALVALPLGYLFESATGIALGIDIARSGAVATAENRYPGRISPNAGLAFLCAGMAFWLLRRPLAGRRQTLYLAATLIVAGIGLAGLAGHALGLETLYRIAGFNRMLPSTALGLAAAAAGLWALQEQTQSFDTESAEGRIKRRSLAVVTLVALGCGVAGFAVMRDTFETSASRNLLLTATTNATSLAHTVDVSLWFHKAVSTRPEFTQSLHRLNREPGDRAARDALQKTAESFLTPELTGLEFHDMQGARLATAGSMLRTKAKFVFPLNTAGHEASLAWLDGFVLLAENDVSLDGAPVGRVFSEQRLPLFDRLLGEVRATSNTSDAAICSRDRDEVVCAPTRLRPEGFKRPLLGSDGKPSLPVVRALLGEHAVMFLTDVRGADVVSAVAPLEALGLGLAVRTDRETLYAPLRSQIGYLVLALLAIVSLAAYAQRSQVRPVLLRLVQSERKLKGILEEQSELVSLARPDGTLAYVNAAYARHFGLVPEQMIGANLYDHVEPADRDAVAANIDAALRSTAPRTTENRMASRSGVERWVAWTNAVQRDGDGQLLLHSVGRDVTERKLAEQRLADSERFVRQVTDSLPVRIAYVDKDLRFRFVNLAHCHRFGLPREQILGRRRDELVKGDVDLHVAEAGARALRGEMQRFEYEETVDGKTVCIESRLIPDVDGAGQVRGFYSTGIDITERTTAERALRDLTTIFDNTTDWVVQTDWRGNVLYMNRAVRRALDLALDAPVDGHRYADFNTPETNRLYADKILPVVMARGVWVGETTVLAADQRVVPVSHMVIAHRDSQGRVARYSAIMRDISEEHAAKEAQQRHAATLRSVTEAIPAFVAVVDANERYRFVNSSFERWMGAKRDTIIGRTVKEVLGPVEYDRSHPWTRRVLAGETVNFEKEYSGPGPARHLAISYIPLWLESGEVDGFVSVAQDITQHKQEEIRLLQLTQRDALTGLLNRAGFEQFLESKLLENGNAQSIALLYIDLDRFKPVNDTHGHTVGDRVLQQFAQRLSQAVRPTDAVARLGGDEFAIVLTGIKEPTNAHIVADKIVAVAQMPFEVDALAVRIGASVGVAFGADAIAGWRELIARADMMLYQAKAAGRGQHAGFA